MKVTNFGSVAGPCVITNYLQKNIIFKIKIFFNTVSLK